MSLLSSLLAGRSFTAPLVMRAINSVYSNVGANLDERNWVQILNSADPLAASEIALQQMYQDHGYLLRNAFNLLFLGYTGNQIVYTYLQLSQRLGYHYSSDWALGSIFADAANLGFDSVRALAGDDYRARNPTDDNQQQNDGATPVLTLSNDPFGLLAQADLDGRLVFTDGTFIANLTANIDERLAVLGALKSGQVVAVSANNQQSTASTQTVTLGTAGDDVYDASGAGAAVQYVFTGNGNDTITGGTGADIIYAGDGDDVIRGSQEDIRLDGGNGNDRLEISANFTVNDPFQIRSIEEIRLMVNGLTLDLRGSFFGETIRGFATGSSTVIGSNGPDIFIGGTGNDEFSGGSGADTFTGGLGNDTYTGGTDDDTFNVDAGTDTITDLQGSDVFVVSAGATLNATVAQEYTASAASRNLGGSAANAVFTVSLNADFANFSLVTIVDATTDGLTINNEKIFGGAVITGTSGNDIIRGQTAIGFAGETLIGGLGADVITGGVGVTTYGISSGHSVARTAETITAANLGNGETITFGNGVDRIVGFVSGTHRLDVATANNYTALAAGADASSLTANNNYSIRGDFNNGTGVFTLNFVGGADLLVVTNAANADLDAAGQTAIVILTGVTSLVAGDFI